MAQRADVKLSTIIGTVDRTSSATVGVDKTFSPEGFIAPGVSRWVDRSGGYALTYPWFTLAVRPPTKASRVYRVSTKMGIPYAETVTASTASGIVPAAPIAYQNQFFGEWLLHERSAPTERAILFSLVRALMATTINANDDSPTDATGSPLVGAVANYDPPY